MTIQKLPLPDLISDNISQQYSYRVLSAQFGDGYSQVAPDGINNEMVTIQIEYRNLPPSQSNKVMTFLRGLKGTQPFEFRVPGDSASGRWRIEPNSLSCLITGVSKSDPTDMYKTITFTAKKVYDI